MQKTVHYLIFLITITKCIAAPQQNDDDVLFADTIVRADASTPTSTETLFTTETPNLDFERHPGSQRISSRSGTAECDGPGTACVPYYLCRDGSIITDGAGVIDIRFGDTVVTQHSNCPRYLDVCCTDPNGTTTHPPPTTHQPTYQCGLRNNDGVHARITGLNVTQTQFGEFPWQVAILRVEKIGGKDVNLYLCGGSLIHPNVVLTAAHCIALYEDQSLKVRAGEWDTQSEYELYPHQDRIVNFSIKHPDFDRGSLWNDFAVLILREPFILAPNVDTVCLPSPSDIFKGTTCVATGWGKDKFGEEGRFQNILKQVQLHVVPHKVCENALKTTRLGEFFKLDESFMCAGGLQNVDTCKGDGGSPLVCPLPVTRYEEPIYFQVGIVAWGIGCGENGVPGVYADVRQGVSWINEVIAPYI